jgi:aspartokinase-like uncharacterized kinase
MSGPLRIVKVGGSLFSLPDLAERLRAWLSRQSATTNVLVAGGGELVDLVRSWDERFRLYEAASHWLAIDLLDATARLLCQLMPESKLVRDVDSWKPGQLTVLAPARFLREQEPDLPGTPLLATWDTTSDSIAARVAEVCGARELVLLKSALPPAFRNIAELAGSYVDQHFPNAVGRLAAVRLVNLREFGFPEVVAKSRSSP